MKKFYLYAGYDGYGAVESDWLQLCLRSGRVYRRVQRQGWLMLRVAVPVGVAGILFLNMGRVREYT